MLDIKENKIVTAVTELSEKKAKEGGYEGWGEKREGRQFLPVGVAQQKRILREQTCYGRILKHRV